MIFVLNRNEKISFGIERRISIRYVINRQSYYYKLLSFD